MMYPIFIEAEDAAGLRITSPSQSGSNPFVVSISDDRESPMVNLTRIKNSKPKTPLQVTVEVEDPSGVEWVRLRYRHVTQFEDYETLEMKPGKSSRTYTATIPAEFIVPEWNLMYFVEALDTEGNGRMYPDLETEMPYVIVELDSTITIS